MALKIFTLLELIRRMQKKKILKLLIFEDMTIENFENGELAPPEKGDTI